MTSQDRTSSIRRFECQSCPAVEPFTSGLSHPKFDASGGLVCHGPVVAVEYVPAGQLQGAVEALKRIERLPRKWEATPTGDRAPWAVVGSEAHKIAADYLKRGR
jgi:hypothetical protein